MATPTFEELFPEIPQQLRDEARENLDRYLTLAIRVEERLVAEAAAEAAALTFTEGSPTIKGERSNQNKSIETG